MGMCLVMCTLSDRNIQTVLTDPPLIWKVVAPHDPGVYASARSAPSGLLSRLFRRKDDNPARPVELDLDLSEDEVVESDLDKAWHGIHYMLTGSAWEGDEPLDFLVGGGEQVGDVEVGYGPARVFSAEQVQALHAALQPIDEKVLRDRFDPAEMMRLKIYPEIWDRDPDEDDSFGYCAAYFVELKAFVGQAAGRGVGLVIHLS